MESDKGEILGFSESQIGGLGKSEFENLSRSQIGGVRSVEMRGLSKPQEAIWFTEQYFRGE